MLKFLSNCSSQRPLCGVPPRLRSGLLVLGAIFLNALMIYPAHSATVKSKAERAANIAGPNSAGSNGAGILDPRTKELVDTRCALCHGREGESASAVYPRLAAQHPDYLVKQLKDFRDGRRKSETMADMVKDLTDAEFTGLAAWFSGRKAAMRVPGDPEFAAVGRYIFVKGNPFSGVPACASCHGDRGHGTHQLPRIAGQHPAYLETQLKEFVKRERTNDNAIMHSVATKLTELELRSVSVYLGGLQ
jgi:cytochrome c553